MNLKKANPLPDKRLLERGAQFMSRIVEKRSCVIRQISTSWKEEMGFWRYLKNKKVSISWLIEQNLAAMKSQQDFVGRHILSLQDSSWRWKIELLFATVKSSGLNLEFALVEYGDKLKKLAILVLMAAIQIIQLLQARDGESQQNMLDCFSAQDVELIQKLNPKLEGNTQKQKNPHPIDSLAFATWVIARLGGWKGYKTHRPPGIKTISRGLLCFYQIKAAAQVFDFDNSV
jgi:hypothetical protein